MRNSRKIGLTSDGKSPSDFKTRIEFKNQAVDTQLNTMEDSLNDSYQPLRARINRVSPSNRNSELKSFPSAINSSSENQLKQSNTPPTQVGSRNSIMKERRPNPNTGGASEKKGGSDAQIHPIQGLLQKMSFFNNPSVESESGNQELRTIKPEKMVEKIYLAQGYRIIYPNYIISYKSRFKAIWDLIYYTYLSAMAVFLPFEAAHFTIDEFDNPEIMFVNVMMLIIYWFDNIFHLRTTYLENENEIIDGKMILKKQSLNLTFFLMIITSIPFFFWIKLGAGNDLTFREKNLLYIQMVRVFLPHKGNHSFISNIKFGLLWRMLMTFWRVYLAIHIFTCIWFGLASQDYYLNKGSETRFWIPSNFHNYNPTHDIYTTFYGDTSNMTQYGHTLYMIALLIAGGDINPVTSYQIPLATVINLLGSLLIGYIFGNITFLISKWNAEKNEYDDKREQLKARMHENKFPPNLTAKITDYFEVQWKKRQIFDRYSNFEEYSEPLKRDLVAHMYRDVIMNVSFFSNLEPPEIIGIIKRLKTQLYMPGDYIVHEGEKGTEMFFIIEGKVKITSAAMKKKESESPLDPNKGIFLYKGSHFGEFALVSNSRRSTDVISMDYCILEVLERNDYLSLSSEFDGIIPRLKEGIKTFKRQRIGQIVENLAKIGLFKSLTMDELKTIVLEYLEEEFIDPNTLVLGPKLKPNSLYIIMLGIVNKFPANEASAQYIRINMFQEDHLLTTMSKEKLMKYKGTSALPALDDLIDEENLNTINLEQAINRAERLEVGGSFGSVRMDDFAISSDSYYFTATACNLLILTQAAVSTMKTNDPVIYQKIKRNLREISKNTVSERVRTEGEDSRARMDTQKSESIFEEYKLNNSNLGELERKVLELSELISIMKFKKD